MAKVNTKFIVLLSGGIIGTVAVAVLAMKLVLKSPAELSQTAADFAAKGDFAAAAVYQSKAVNKEQANVEYLTKWRDYLKQYAPPDQTRGMDALTKLATAQRQLGVVQRDNVEAQRDFLDGTLARIKVQGEFNNDACLQLIIQTEDFLAFHDGQPAGRWQTLERYRGWALSEIVQNSPEAKKTDIEKAKKSLEIAATADPDDVLVALSAEALYRTLAGRAEKAKLNDEAAALGAKSLAILSDFLARHPESAEAQLRALAIAVDDSYRKVIAITDPKARDEAARLAFEDWDARLTRVTEGMKTAKPGTLGPEFRAVLRNLEQIASPRSQLTRSLAAFEELLKSNPNDSRLLIDIAMIHADRGEYAKAIEIAQQVIALPNQPTSLGALILFDQRVTGQFLEALWTAKYSDEPKITPEVRQARLARVKELCDKLQTQIDPESPQVLLVKGYLSYLNNNPAEAGQYVDRFNAKTRRASLDAPGGDKNSQWLMYLIQMKLNKPGDAKKALIACLQFDERNYLAVLALAELEAQLRNPDVAMQIIDKVLERLPDFPVAIDLRKRILVQQGKGTSEDPIINAIMQVDAKVVETQGQPDADEKVLAFAKEQAAAHKNDPRLLQVVARMHLKLGQRAEAAAVLNQILAASPDDADAKMLLKLASAKDDVDATIEVINSDPSTSEYMKALQCESALRRAGRREESKVYFDKALALDPENAGTLEMRFNRALEDRDEAEAEKISALAVTRDLDGYKGLLYKANLLGMKRDFGTAIKTLQQAMAMGNPSPEIYRLLGRYHYQLGNSSEAVKAYERAIEARPNDVDGINDLIGALMSDKRFADALGLARSSEKYAGGNPLFRERYNILEAMAGDKAAAIQRRERQARVAPDDRGNLLALAGLYLEAKRWTDAKAKIDAARALAHDNDTARILAYWHWQQGQKDEARKTFSEFIKTQSGADALGATLRFADFLFMVGEAEEGTKVLTDARPLQDPKRMQVDRALSEVHMGRGNFAEAMVAAKAIVDANADEKGLYKLRYAECLINVGESQKGLDVLDTIAKKGDEDLVTLLLKAQAFRGLKQPEQQRAMLDQAVARFPNDAVSFKQRGIFLLGQSISDDNARRQAARDAKEDFDTALRLRPDDAETLKLRAKAHIEIDPKLGITPAIADTRQSIRLNPGDLQLMYGTVADLLRPRFSRPDESMSIAEEAMARDPKNVKLLTTLAGIFSDAKEYQKSVRFLRVAMEADPKSPEIAQLLLDSFLNQTPPAIGEAEAVLQTMQSQVASNPGFLMAFAKIRLLQGKLADADKYAVDAVKLLDPKKPGQMLAWFNDIQRVQADTGKVVIFLDNIAKMGVTSDAAEWLTFLKGKVWIAEEANRQKGIDLLSGLTSTAKVPVVNQLSYRLVGATHYAAARYADAAKVWEEALTKYPDDYECLNNLAYTYLKYLNRKEDALKAASAAAEKLPASGDVQDTYGVALMANGRAADSVRIFQNALLLSGNPQAETTVLVHLAEALMATNSEADAKDAVVSAMTRVQDNPNEISDDIKAEVEALKKKLGL